MLKNAVQINKKAKLIILDNIEQIATETAQYFYEIATQISFKKNMFSVALSGGQTPKLIYEKISQNYKEKIDWEKMWLFWSDERAVPFSSNQSNYNLAMQAGFKDMPIPKNQIFRMQTEHNLEKAAKNYEDLIKTHLKKDLFDLVLLGLGVDGHTASLFPDTTALQEKKKLVVSNYIPKLKTHRLTLTYPCINNSKNILVIAYGEDKKEIVKNVLLDNKNYPSNFIGTENNNAYWIIDKKAASLL
jgi:6-phosphogluconolactonase